MDGIEAACGRGHRELEFEVAPIHITGCALCFILFGHSSPLWGIEEPDNEFNPGKELTRCSEDKWV